MRPLIVALLSLALAAACYRVPRAAAPPAWESAPLAPRLQLIELAPGDVVLLVIDGHSGAPIRGVVASFDSTSRIAYGDTLGRVRFHAVPAGPLRLRVRRLGYEMRHDSITLQDASGMALVVQMKRMPLVLEQVGQPTIP